MASTPTSLHCDVLRRACVTSYKMLPVAGEECGTFDTVTVRPTADGAAKSDPSLTGCRGATYVSPILSLHAAIPVAARSKAWVCG